MAEHHIFTLPRYRGRSLGRLYYYKGNFYYPLNLADNLPGLVRRHIREFSKANAALIKADRAAPDYQSLDVLIPDAR